MPCLLFSRIVPAFTRDNISSLGPLTVIGLFYGVVGAMMAWVIRRFFWVPHRFRYGIIAAGGWGNYGDIRMYPPLKDDLTIESQVIFLWCLATAIAMGLTASAPFDGVNDQNLAIAYISTLILVFFVRLLCFQAPHNIVFLPGADGRLEDHPIPSRRVSHRCQRLRGARCRFRGTSREDAPSAAEDGHKCSPVTQTSHAALWTAR